MANQYLFDPNNQFQNVSGVNNVAGFLRVFYNGTDDRALTYKDFNGTANPADIPIDNNGRAVVIVDEDKTYRLEVYDRDGALLWSQYPLVPMGGGSVVDCNVAFLTTEQGWTEINDAIDKGKEVLLKIGYSSLSLSYYQRGVLARFVCSISADSNKYDYNCWELDSNGAWNSYSGYSKTAIIDDHTSFTVVKSLLDLGVVPILKVNSGSVQGYYHYCYGSGPFYFQMLFTDLSVIQPNPYANNIVYRLSSDNSWTAMSTRPMQYAERCAYDGDLNEWDPYYNTIRTQGNYLYKFKVPSDYSWTGLSMRTDAVEPQEGHQLSNATVILDNSEFNQDVTLNFCNSDRSKTLKYSSSSGNIIHAGAVALIKIKGMFWTMDEFT